MKIYVAGKITGEKNYKKYFNKAEKELKKSGHLCMNPAALPEGFEYQDYIRICYAMIDACEAVYLLNNWKESKGAMLEYEYAKSKNKIIFEN